MGMGDAAVGLVRGHLVGLGRELQGAMWRCLLGVGEGSWGRAVRGGLEGVLLELLWGGL